MRKGLFAFYFRVSTRSKGSDGAGSDGATVMAAALAAAH